MVSLRPWARAARKSGTVTARRSGPALPLVPAGPLVPGRVERVLTVMRTIPFQSASMRGRDRHAAILCNEAASGTDRLAGASFSPLPRYSGGEGSGVRGSVTGRKAEGGGRKKATLGLLLRPP